MLKAAPRKAAVSLYGLLSIAAALSAMPIVKLGPLQATEFMAIVSILAAIPVLVHLHNVGPRRYWALAGLMFATLIAGAVLRSDEEFYPVAEKLNSVLYQPIAISALRLVQLCICFAVAILIYSDCQRKPNQWLRYAKLMVTTGFVCVLLSITSFVLHQLKPAVSVGISHLDEGIRLSGLFNEGGPFGLFLVGICTVHLCTYNTAKRANRFRWWIVLSLLVLGIIMTESKNALAAIAMLCILGIIIALKRKNVAIGMVAIATSITIVATALTFTDAQVHLKNYYNHFTQAPMITESNKEDYNVVAGRVAGWHIMPRIIEHRPLLGIGIGNYPLVRNTPHYLGDFPPVEIWDLGGSGVLSLICEFGALGTMLFACVLGYPLYYSVKRRTPLYIILLSAYPLIAVLLGVQYYFLYVWILAAIAFAAVTATETSA